MTVADDFSHECVSNSVDWDISGQHVTRWLDQAAIATWRQDYNEVRPHSSVECVPPARFAELNRHRNQLTLQPRTSSL